MNDNYYNLSPEEKKKRDEDIYQKFIILGIVPLFIYLMWPFLFNTQNELSQAQVVEERIEKVEEKVEESQKLEASSNQEEMKVAPAVAPQRKPNKKLQKPGIIKKEPVRPNNNTNFTLSHNAGDEIEYIMQNAGWKGIVQSKQNGSYTVKITEVITANAQQQFLPGNNPCFGGKPIGKNANNQVITVPGRCIHKR